MKKEISRYELRELVESGKAQILTLSKAKELYGKHIYWFYFGYEGNKDVMNDNVVGKIVSSYDLAKSEVMDNGCTRLEYWNTVLTKEEIEKEKNKLCLFDLDNSNMFVFCFTDLSENFTCTDSDRYVYYFE